MASTYDIPNYLLDRANIEDLIHKAYFSFDEGKLDKLSSDIFAPKIIQDYTAFFGGEPKDLTGDQFVEEWQGFRNVFTDGQHIFTSVVPDLPQPGAITPPTTAKATANSVVFMKSRAGKPYENKSRGIFEFVKLSDVEGNPWRISRLQVGHLLSQNGTLEELANDAKEAAGVEAPKV